MPIEIVVSNFYTFPLELIAAELQQFLVILSKLVLFVSLFVLYQIH